jgi:hypothetical protein
VSEVPNNLLRSHNPLLLSQNGLELEGIGQNKPDTVSGGRRELKEENCLNLFSAGITKHQRLGKI